MRKIAILVGIAACAAAVAPVGAVGQTGVPQGMIALDVDFTSGRPAGGWIEVASLSGSGRRILTRPPSAAAPHDDFAPAWSPDGTRLAFVRSSAGGRSGLYVVNRDGTGLRRLVRGNREEFASWSMDGSRIASWSAGNECSYPQGRVPPRLWISKADGSGSVELPALLDAEASSRHNNVAGTVKWSKDGRKLLYGIDQYGGGEECRQQTPASLLYAIDANGRHRRKLVSRDGVAGTILDADWAPDGQAVAFLALDGVFETELIGRLVERQIFPLAVDLGEPFGLAWLRTRELVFTSPRGLEIADPRTRMRRTLLRGAHLALATVSAGRREAAVVDPDNAVSVVSLDGTKWWRIAERPSRVPRAELAGLAVFLN